VFRSTGLHFNVIEEGDSAEQHRPRPKQHSKERIVPALYTDNTRYNLYKGDNNNSLVPNFPAFGPLVLGLRAVVGEDDSLKEYNNHARNRGPVDRELHATDALARGDATRAQRGDSGGDSRGGDSRGEDGRGGDGRGGVARGGVARGGRARAGPTRVEDVPIDKILAEEERRVDDDDNDDDIDREL
jgi:hypothetical protein